MKIKITDIHHEDVHYNNKDQMIGVTCELNYVEQNRDLPGWSAGEVYGGVSGYFYAFKYEEYDEPNELAKDPVWANNFLRSAGIIEADGEPSPNYYDEEAIDKWRKSRIRELLGRIKFESNSELIKFLTELKNENIDD